LCTATDGLEVEPTAFEATIPKYQVIFLGWVRIDETSDEGDLLFCSFDAS
jgi:hypothetical protein